MAHFIESKIHTAFVKKAIRNNWTLTRLISVVILGVEGFNIVRVIFFSPSGLTTLNNWIYFLFYSSLFLAAAAFLLADGLLGRRLSSKVRYRILQFVGSFFVIWQALFAVYDLSSLLSVGKISGVVALVAFAALYMMRPVYAVVNILAGYAIILAYLFTLNDPGTVLNYSIVGLMTLVIYFAQYDRVCTELNQAARIKQMDRDMEEIREKLRRQQELRIRELEKEVSMDTFTGTLNKTALENYGVRRLGQTAPQERLAMLILDVDDFKAINDTCGHRAGDHVLVQLGRLMNTLAPEGCQVGRLGGDEFAAIFDPPCTRLEVESYARQLSAALRTIEWEGRPMSIGCSIGVAACPGGTAYSALYAAADQALYQAKRQGKGRCCIDPAAGLP